MRKTRALVGLLACLCTGAAPAETAGTASYDLLFRNGTLDDLPRAANLVYDRSVTNRAAEDAADRDTGEIALSFEETAETTLANLEFRKNGKHRNLGSFPSTVGNPMIMYFYETVVRDMAETAGGSPFYIRNRVKDELRRPATTEAGTAEFDGRSIETVSVVLRPFEGDPNRDRMSGFGDLAMEVTMSEDIPGWYLQFEARAPHPDGGAPIYRSVMTFDGVETGE